ncbi:MAG TPA: hypothetical protein VF546_07120 [Pyrinomonadaceae bacterium]
MSKRVQIIRSRQPAAASESAAGLRALDDECVAFARYLVRQTPSAYVQGKYREAHAAGGLCQRRAGDHFDHFLLHAAARHPRAARLVDAYTAVFCKRATVRKKWVLLLAIMESCGPSYLYFDAPEPYGKRVLAIRMLWQGAAFVLTLGLAVLLLLPAQLGCGAWAQLSRRSE